MTTLVGIVAEKGKQGVVLASDINRTTREWKSQGDVAYKQLTKSNAQKIYVHNRDDFAVCMTGVYDQAYVDFLGELLDCDDAVREAIKTGDFPKLRDLNIERVDRTILKGDNMNGLLFATRFDGEPKLYTTFPLGKFVRRAWTAVGSGSQYAIEYIREEALKYPGRNPPGITLNDGVDLAVNALDAASQDLYTGGLDLVVVTEDGIKTYGKQIKDKVEAAEKRAIREIKKEF